MKHQITAMTSGGTPWWGTLLIALGGALVGGGFAIYSGYLIHRRSEQAQRIARVLQLGAEMAAAASMLSGVAITSHEVATANGWQRARQHLSRGAGRRRADDLLAAEVALIRAATELHPLVVRSELGTTVAKINGSLGMMVYANWADEDEFAAQFEVTRELTEDLQGRLRNFAGMTRREATAFLSTGVYWYNDQQ